MLRSTGLKIVALLLAGGVLCTTAYAVNRIDNVPLTNISDEVGYVPNEFIVVLAPGVGAIAPTDYAAGDGSGVQSLDLLASQYGVEMMWPQFRGAAERGITVLSRNYKVRFAGRHDLDAVLASYAADPAVDHVEPIGIHPVHATPNDGFYLDQWHLDQASDHDVDAPEAWDIETGSTSIVVAILDTGVRYYHKDLGGVNASSSNPGAARGNMWINSAELNGSPGIDDDGNGYIDDWVGYDFVDGGSNCWTGEDCNVKDNDPRDFNGHGTHCAGNVSAMNNNGYATCAPSGGWESGSIPEYGNGVRTMACRVGWSGSYFGQEVGYVRMDFCAEGFYYAADNGALVASCSWGSSNSGGISTAVTYFTDNGGLVFKSAGNDGGQTADYLCGRSDVISVASTDENDCKSSFSTYGTWVDISAPGSNIMSLYHSHADPSGDYVATMSGTSMASPLAASVAALIWSKNPGWTAAQVEQQLYDSADDIDGLPCNSAYVGKLGAGRINAYNAVNTGTPPPAAAFSGTPTSGCVPLLVDFTDASTGEITSWDWDFGDGGQSTSRNPSHQYNGSGTYAVSLTVTGPGGSDTETKTDYITVYGVPAADFSGSPTSGAAPLTVSFADLSTGNPTSWLWDFGDGGTSTQQNPTYGYAGAGDYEVTLTATNACGSDVETKIGYIHVDPPAPIAAFSATPTSGCAPLLVDFTDESTGGVTSWDWDFGDGGTSTAQNPSYQYSSAGAYTVSLTVTGPSGSDAETKTGYIRVNDVPAADFAGVPTSGTAPLTVDFTDLSAGNPTSWLWEFGDGGTSTQQNPTYEYASDGDYDVTLTATNGCGSDSETKTGYIHVDPAEPFALALSDIAVAGTVSGDYTDTHAGDGQYEAITEVSSQDHPRKWYSLLEHKWNFTVASGTSIMFYVEAYRPGNADGDDFAFQYSTDNANFTPLVTVNSDVEQVYSASIPSSVSGAVYIRVIDTDRTKSSQSLDTIYIDQMYIESSSTPMQPIADFSASPTGGAAPLTVQFMDLSLNGPEAWDWDFGDGGGSTLQNPTHEYATTGSYTVTLTASNAQGSDVETKVDYITVTDGSATIHVREMIVARKIAGPNHSGQCTVIIYDSVDQPVANATVYVTATGPTGGSYSGLTLADGSVQFETSKTKNPVGEWCFEVTDVTHASYAYNPGANNATKVCESGVVYGGDEQDALRIPGAAILSDDNPTHVIGASTISFRLEEGSTVRLDVINIAGSRVARLADGWREAGTHSVVFDPATLPSGIYFYRLETERGIESNKILIAR